MGQESPRESRETAPPTEDPEVHDDHVYAFMVEECVLLAFDGHHPKCPIHGDLVLGQIAPDTVFLDLDDRLRIQNETIKRGGLIGRGAFGFVYEAVCRTRGQTGPRNVALKMLQPINPGLNADEGTSHIFKCFKYRCMYSFFFAKTWEIHKVVRFLVKEQFGQRKLSKVMQHCEKRSKFYL